MFADRINLTNGTELELVIIKLNGTKIQGQWETDTELLLLCHIPSNRCCTCKKVETPHRFQETLGISREDAVLLANWLSTANI